MTESLAVLEALKSEQCACGAPKAKRQSFCLKCYTALPAKLRGELYKGFSQGYAEHYEEALEWLKANTTRVRR